MSYYEDEDDYEKERQELAKDYLYQLQKRAKFEPNLYYLAGETRDRYKTIIAGNLEYYIVETAKRQQTENQEYDIMRSLIDDYTDSVETDEIDPRDSEYKRIIKKEYIETEEENDKILAYSVEDFLAYLQGKRSFSGYYKIDKDRLLKYKTKQPTFLFKKYHPKARELEYLIITIFNANKWPDLNIQEQILFNRTGIYELNTEIIEKFDFSFDPEMFQFYIRLDNPFIQEFFWKIGRETDISFNEKDKDIWKERVIKFDRNIVENENREYRIAHIGVYNNELDELVKEKSRFMDEMHSATETFVRPRNNLNSKRVRNQR